VRQNRDRCKPLILTETIFNYVQIIVQLQAMCIIDDVYITEGVYSLVCFQNYTLVYTKIFGIVCTKRLIGIIFT
jgi:hypothetical protein